MAPASSDPRDLMTVLSLRHRAEFTLLISDITNEMRMGTEKSFNTLFETRTTFNRQLSNNSYQDRENAQRDASEPRLKEPISNPQTASKFHRLRFDTMTHFDSWQRSIISKLGEVINASNSNERSARGRQARPDLPPRRNMSPKPDLPPRPDLPPSYSSSSNVVAEAEEVHDLQDMYPPLSTSLSRRPRTDREVIISSMLLLILSLGNYSAHSRILLLYLTSSLDLPLSVLTTEESEVAKTLLEAAKEMSGDKEAQKRREENKISRRWKVGLAGVGGAIIVGVTGGLAAPVVASGIGALMGGIGLGAAANVLGIFFMNGALVGTIFGAFGGRMTGEMVDAYAKDVQDFKFLPLHEVPVQEGQDPSSAENPANSKERKLRVTIGINGWLRDKDDVLKPWRTLGPDSEVFALRYEMDALLNLGNSLDTMVSSYAWGFVKTEILKRTVLASLTAVLWPVYLLKMATSVDNPFSLARSRSEKAGEVLADALINKAQGERPVTLIGYSLGARVIHSCLMSLVRRRAFGLVESVVFIGAPVPSNSHDWRAMRSVVSGKVVNVFSENDYILGFLYRTTSIQLGVAGLQKIEDVPGVDNFDLSAEVSGHLRYPDLIGQILVRVGFSGVEIEDAAIERDIIVDETGKVHLVDEELNKDLGDLQIDDNDVPAKTSHPSDTSLRTDNKEPNEYIEPKSMANDSRLRQSTPKAVEDDGKLHLVEAKSVSKEDEGGLRLMEAEPISEGDDGGLRLMEAEPISEEDDRPAQIVNNEGKISY